MILEQPLIIGIALIIIVIIFINMNCNITIINIIVFVIIGRYEGWPGLGYDKKDEVSVHYTDSIAGCVHYCRSYPGQ